MNGGGGELGVRGRCGSGAGKKRAQDLCYGTLIFVFGPFSLELLDEPQNSLVAGTIKSQHDRPADQSGMNP